MTSHELVARAVARAKEGDISALHFLYVSYVDDVVDQVQSIVGESRAAEEITQSVFTELAATTGNHETHEVGFESWILRAARSAALDGYEAVQEVHCSDDGPNRNRTRAHGGPSTRLRGIDALRGQDRVDAPAQDPDDPSGHNPVPRSCVDRTDA